MFDVAIFKNGRDRPRAERGGPLIAQYAGVWDYGISARPADHARPVQIDGNGYFGLPWKPGLTSAMRFHTRTHGPASPPLLIPLTRAITSRSIGALRPAKTSRRKRSPPWLKNFAGGFLASSGVDRQQVGSCKRGCTASDTPAPSAGMVSPVGGAFFGGESRRDNRAPPYGLLAGARRIGRKFAGGKGSVFSASLDSK